MTNDTREAWFQSLKEEVTGRGWREEAFQAKLQLVLPENGVPLTMKVHHGTRLAVLRACRRLSLATQSVQPLEGYRGDDRWVVVGTNQRAVHDKAAEIEHRIIACEGERELRAQTVDASAQIEDEEQDLRHEAIELARRSPASEHEDDLERPQNQFPNVLLRIPGANLRELRSIKQGYVMHGGHVLDPDVDVWIPDDPRSKTLGQFASGNGDQLKAYWIAQCFFRDIPVETKDSVLLLQGKLRDREEDTETRIEALQDVCERVLDAEWRLENPRARFNVRAVRKSRAIMLQPERSSIARGLWSANNIRPEVREQHHAQERQQRYAAY